MNNRKIRFKYCIPILMLLTLSVTDVCAQHYTEIFGWRFPNYRTDILEWEIYRDTFIGIPPTRNPASSGFDVLFYDHLYRTELAAQGNCYGLSVMSILMRKKGGHLGYCLPVSQYPGDLVAGTDGFDGPTDPLLSRAINQIHGHQVNVPSLKQYLEIIAISKNRDGLYAFDQANYYQSMDDFTVVSITETMNPVDGGHTMVAYDTQEFGPNDKRIYVYDPNRSWFHPMQQSFYTSGSNYIQIRADRSWSFELTSDDPATPEDETRIWEGSPASGGNCIITPLSICGPRSRTPSSMGLNALSFANQFFIFGEGAGIEQISNEEGKQLFVPGTKDIDTDPNTGMLNTVPWFPSDAGHAPFNFASYFQFGAPGGALDLQVNSGENGYRLDIAGPKSHLRVQSFGGRGLEALQIQDPGTTNPVIALRNTINSERYNIQFTQVVKENEETRIFRLNELLLPANNPVELKISDNQDLLNIFTEQTEIEYDLEIEKVTLSENYIIEIPRIIVNPGELQTIRPNSWNNFTEDDIQIQSTRMVK